jgi:hypothetical protein
MGEPSHIDPSDGWYGGDGPPPARTEFSNAHGGGGAPAPGEHEVASLPKPAPYGGVQYGGYGAPPAPAPYGARRHRRA